MGGGSWPTYPRQRRAHRVYERHLDQRAGTRSELQERWNVSGTAPIFGPTHCGRWGRVLGRLERPYARDHRLGDGPVVHLPWHHAQTTKLSLHPRHPGHLQYADDRHDRRTTGALGRRRSARQMVALDVSSGKVVWQTPLGTEPGSSIWSSPAYYKGSIYVGLASFQGCPQEFGRIVRLNAATGALQAALNFKSIRASQVPRAGCMVIARHRPGGRRRLHSAPRTTSATRVTKTPSSG